MNVSILGCRIVNDGGRLWIRTRDPSLMGSKESLGQRCLEGRLAVPSAPDGPGPFVSRLRLTSPTVRLIQSLDCRREGSYLTLGMVPSPRLLPAKDQVWSNSDAGAAGHPQFSDGDGACGRAILENRLSGLTPVGGCNTMDMLAVDCLPSNEGEGRHRSLCWGQPPGA
jgi:hypothetical protein